MSLGWLLAGEQLLEQHLDPGRSREALLGPALDRLRPLIVQGDSHVVPMSLFAACATLTAWIVLGAAAGVWKVQRRDA